MAGSAGYWNDAGGESGGHRSGADSQDLWATRPNAPEVSAQRDVAERDREVARGSGKRDSGASVTGAARRTAAVGKDGAPAGRCSLAGHCSLRVDVAAGLT